MSFILPKLLTEDALRATGIHFGVKDYVTKDMQPFVVKITPDGNPIFDLPKILDRLVVAGKFISKCEQPVVYATDKRFANALKAFQRVTNIKTIFHRFVPGTLTNPNLKTYVDSDLLLVSDPANGLPKGDVLRAVYTGDRRAIEEATALSIPIVAICNSNATLSDIDFAIPANNVGPKGIATVFYLLSRAVLFAKGTLKLGEDIQIPLSAFETEQKEEVEEE
jgi:small subunit ribosomal protein S2